jgi:hypothetical protein
MILIMDGRLLGYCLIVAAGCLSATASHGFDGIHGSGFGRAKLNYDSLFQAAIPLAESEEGRKLVAHCISAYGGVEHLGKLRTQALHYRMAMTLSAGEAEASKYVSSERRHRAVRHLGEFTKERLLNGDSAWRIVGDSVCPLQGADYCGQLFSYFTLNLPLAMTADDFSEVRYGRRNGDPLSYIYMLIPDSLMFIAGIRAGDGMVMSSEGVMLATHKRSTYINLFSDHREEEGYIFPHLLTNISLGLEVAKSVLLGVDLNPALTDDLFKPKRMVRESH